MSRKHRNILILVAVAVAAGATLLLKEERSHTQPGQPAAVSKVLPTLVDLGAGKCIPCKRMAPILDELKVGYAGQFEVTFYDVWKDPEPGKTFGIRLIPTQVFLDAEGKELFRHEGFYGKDDILGKWEDLGYAFETTREN